jgi:hypothetical protein
MEVVEERSFLHSMLCRLGTRKRFHLIARPDLMGTYLLRN